MERFLSPYVTPLRPLPITIEFYVTLITWTRIIQCHASHASLTLRSYDSPNYFFLQCFLVPQEAEQKGASELEELGKTAAEYKKCFEQLTKGLCCLYLALVTHFKD